MTHLRITRNDKLEMIIHSPRLLMRKYLHFYYISDCNKSIIIY